MRLRTRILFTYCIFFIPAFIWLTTDFQDNLKFRYLEGVEETLVDQARLLAGLVSEDIEARSFPETQWHRVFDRVYGERFTARIYQLLKTHVDMRVYLTDDRGRLVFDSRRQDPPGTDYSRWRDVLLTLQGEYGARSSKEDPSRPDMSTLYIAAPVWENGKIRGVLSVGKPTANINDFLATAKRRILKQSLVAALLALVLSLLTMAFITRPLDHLNRYVKSVRAGKDAKAPRFGRGDIGEVGRAFEQIRADLAARQYIESYVQSLTHELKSPVSAIAGAAELLDEKMPDTQRKRFTANIRTESERIQALVDRMLSLSSLEHQNGLARPESVDMSGLISKAVHHPETGVRDIRITRTLTPGCRVTGDALLLGQAVDNLIQNALEFSPGGGEIRIELEETDGWVVVRVGDQGPGIPDYAREKIFDRFFSLQRPATGKKSTGLGLNFVKEIAHLHGGTICVDNGPAGGTIAVLKLPPG